MTCQCRSPWCKTMGDGLSTPRQVLRQSSIVGLAATNCRQSGRCFQRRRATDYFERVKQTTGSGEFATRMLSTPGRRDGLYWSVSEGEPESPLGPLIDAARDADYAGELVNGIPYGGTISHPQGAGTKRGWWCQELCAVRPDGRRLCVDRVASGIEVKWNHEFIVGPDGDVYQKDLGSETAGIAARMTTFDPDLGHVLRYERVTRR